MELFKFLLTGSFVTIVIFAFYTIFMKQQNRPRLNRVYLLSGVVAIFCIPFLQFSFLQNAYTGLITLPEIAVGVGTGLASENTAGQSITFLQIIGGAYFIGMIAYVFLTLNPIIRMISLIKGSPKVLQDQCTLVFAGTKVKYPFSFFKYIVLPAKDESECDPLIIQHEKAHIKLKHHYDLILMFIFGAVFWFLPFARWYFNQLKAVHEFEADSMVVEHADNQQYVNCLFNQAFDVKTFSFFSHFSKPHLLNRRLDFLFKEKKKGFSPAYFLFWPLLIGLMFSQSCVNNTADKPYIIEGEIYTIVDEMPEYPGGHEGLMTYLQTVDYPEEAREAKIEGRVYVQFVVDKSGRVGNVEIVGISAHDLLAEAALKHIRNMPNWTKAGKLNGEYVHVKYTIPFNFTLPEE